MSKVIHLVASLALVIFIAFPSLSHAQEKRPNIVLMLSDNLGYGDIGSYGGGAVRGAPTPNIDQLAGQGMRFTNFNVEAECTPSRSALMTGRLPVRSGTTRAIPVPGLPQGLAPWEVTIAEVLKQAGYNTAMFGKWHLGYQEDRLPVSQGFDEWWGFPFSTGISMAEAQVGFEFAGMKQANFWEGTAKDGVTKQEVYSLKNRPLVDAKIAKKSVDYIKAHANDDEPFFLYVPWSLPHHPSIPHPDFEGITKNGRFADVIVEHDARVGQVINAIEEAGIADNTIVIYASDNGPDRAEYPDIGDTGPFRGYLGTVHEGSVRTPMAIRWPGQVPEGKVTNEIVSIVDLFSTLAEFGGASEYVPDDRPIDGMNMADFFTGKVDASGRETAIFFAGDELRAVKWRQFKIYFQGERTGVYERSIDNIWAPEVYNTMIDPKEMNNIATMNLWTLYPAFQSLMKFIYSVQQDGLVETGGEKPTRFELDVPFFRWEQLEEGLGEIKKQMIKKKVGEVIDNIKSSVSE